MPEPCRLDVAVVVGMVPFFSPIGADDGQQLLLRRQSARISSFSVCGTLQYWWHSTRTEPLSSLSASCEQSPGSPGIRGQWEQDQREYIRKIEERRFQEYILLERRPGVLEELVTSQRGEVSRADSLRIGRGNAFTVLVSFAW